MSRGLGRVERMVLAWLLSYGPRAELSLLAWYVAGLQCCPRHDRPWNDQRRPSRAAYVSTCRAVAALERKGYVRTEVRQAYLETYRFKLVELSVDRAAIPPAVQRLTCEGEP